MSDEVVQSKYELDVSDYVDGIKKVISETERLVEKTEDVGEETEKVKDKSKTSWATVAIGINQALEIGKKFIDIMAGVANKLIEFRNVADDEQDSVEAMNLQLKNMGIYTENLSQKLIANSKTLEDNSNFMTAAVNEGTAMLLTFNDLSEDILPAATQAMVDMSTVMKTSLTSSAQTIGKALQDPINGLGLLTKQGFHFTEQQKAMIEQLVNENDILGAQKIILEEIDKAYGGHAKLQKDELESLSISWKNFKSVIGTIVKPALDGIATQFASILSNITEILKKGEEAKKIAAGKSGELTTEALQKQISDKRKEIDNYKTQINEKKQELGKVSDSVDEGIREQIKNLENEITARVKIINMIGAEISRRDDLSKKQDEANKKKKKDEANAAALAQEKADRASQEDKDFEVMFTNTQDLSKQSTDSFIAKEPKTNNELQLSDKEYGAETPDEHKEKLRKQKEDDLDYTIRLNADIQAREDEALQASLESQRLAGEEQQRMQDRHLKNKKSYLKQIKSMNDEMKNSYKDVRDVTKGAIEDVLLGEQESLAEYGKILADKLAARMASIASEATIQSLWETAQGIAALANPITAPTAKGHFSAAVAYGQVASAAGLGAFAAASISRGLAGESKNDESSNNSSSTTNTETESIQTASAKALEDKETIYISANDWKKMAFYNIDAINDALASGKSLKLKK